MVVNLSTKGASKKGKQYAEAETMVAEGTAGSDKETVVQHESEIVELVNLPEGNGAMDAEVEFGLGAVIPTGEFSNIRAHVHAKVRCEADTDVMDKTFDVVKDWVDNKLSGVVAEIQTGQ